MSVIDHSTSPAIDNGRRVALTIDRVFDGEAGESGGVVSFITTDPKAIARARSATSGMMAGTAVRLSFIGRDGPFLSYRWEAQP